IVRRGRPARLSAADLANILTLHKQGHSARAIASQLDRSPSAVAKAIRDGQRRATRAAVREGQDGLVQDAKRRRDAERQRRKRERDKTAERAREIERAGQTAEERRATAARPTGGIQGEPEPERQAKVWLL